MARFFGKAFVGALCALFLPLGAAAQTLSPPVAEYRGKADGSLTLTNNGDVPLAAILEVRSFSVGAHGRVQYGGRPKNVRVRLGSNSFLIPAHESHYVFYRATCERAPCWFAIMNTLTRSTPIHGGLRINIILPHLVYVYQKQKIKKKDVRVFLSREGPGGVYRLEVENLSAKLGRVETIEASGFGRSASYETFPLFPLQTRTLLLRLHRPSKRAHLKIIFEDGLRLNVPVSGDNFSAQTVR